MRTGVDQDTPIFINCRDRLEPLESLVGWLERASHERIYLVDNASTFPPLLQYYEDSPHTIVRLSTNLGHLAPWLCGVVEREALGQWYVVTDPDVVPIAECPPDAVRHFRAALERYPTFVKAGFGLLIDDLPDHYAQASAVRSWEQQFWRRRFDRDFYHASLDTTFALYRPYQPTFEFKRHPSIRTGAPYVARHLPWYAVSAEPTAEETYYVTHARVDVTNWHGIGEAPVGDAPPWSVLHKLRWRAHARFRLERFE